MSDFPEHEKLQALGNDNNVVAEFLEWLETKNYSICEWRDYGDNSEPRWIALTDEEKIELEGKYARGEISYFDYYERKEKGKPNYKYECWSSEFHRVGKTTEEFLADYFEVDLAKLREEKEAMYQTIKEANKRAEVAS